MHRTEKFKICRCLCLRAVFGEGHGRTSAPASFGTSSIQEQVEVGKLGIGAAEQQKSSVHVKQSLHFLGEHVKTEPGVVISSCGISSQKETACKDVP